MLISIELTATINLINLYLINVSHKIRLICVHCCANVQLYILSELMSTSQISMRFIQ